MPQNARLPRFGRISENLRNSNKQPEKSYVYLWVLDFPERGGPELFIKYSISLNLTSKLSKHSWNRREIANKSLHHLSNQSDNIMLSTCLTLLIERQHPKQLHQSKQATSFPGCCCCWRWRWTPSPMEKKGCCDRKTSCSRNARDRVVYQGVVFIFLCFFTGSIRRFMVVGCVLGSYCGFINQIF